MIKISVDEAYAFDILTILYIKKNNTMADTNNYEKMIDEIRNQVGDSKFYEILMSPEYKNLLTANKLVYDYVDKIRNGEKLDAKEVDDANMLRYKYKKDLQIKYFGNNVTEQKT
jgi:hypothetical protein